MREVWIVGNPYSKEIWVANYFFAYYYFQDFPKLFIISSWQGHD